MRYDGAGPKRMHSGISGDYRNKLEDGHRPQQVRGDGGFLHQNKDHVIGKHGIEDVLGDIAPRYMPRCWRKIFIRSVELSSITRRLRL